MKKYFFLLSFAAATALFAAEVKKPDWATNTYGMEGLSPDFVEPGYGLKPLQLFGRVIMQDGKRTELSSKTLLPVQAVVKSKNVFASAPELIIDGAALEYGKAKIAKKGKNSITGTVSAKAKDFALKADLTVDFDGTMVYDLTLTPEKAAKISRLSLKFPLNLPDDKLIYACSELPNKLVSGLEAERKRHFLNLKDGRIFKPGNCTIFWAGNTNYGWSILSPGVHNWHVKEGDEYIFNSKTGLLTVNIINYETVLDKPVTYRFFFNVTPVRRMPSDWRAWRYGTRYNNFNPTDNSHLIYWQFWRANRTECHNNLWHWQPEMVRKIAEFDKKAGRKILHYTNPIMYSHTIETEYKGKKLLLIDPYLRELANKHKVLPQSTYLNQVPVLPKDATVFTSAAERNKAQNDELLKGKVATEFVAQVPEIRNHHIAQIKAMIDLGCDGLYVDCCGPTIDFRPGPQGGMPDDRGKLRPYYYITEFREMFKRIRALVRNNNPEAQMMGHCGGAPVMSLFDSRLIGENEFYWYKEPDVRDLSQDGKYYYAYIWGDIDNLKVNYARQWGVPTVLLPELRARDGKVFKEATIGTRTMLSYTIQFDYSYWPLWCDAREIIKFDAIRQKFGMKDTTDYIIDFVPYWENKLFKSSDENVKVGYYEHIQQFDPDIGSKIPRWKRYLVLVSNVQFSESKVTVELPEMILNGKLKAIDRQTGKAVEVKDGKITLDIAPYDFDVIEVYGQIEE